jgi:hypothetical protein
VPAPSRTIGIPESAVLFTDIDRVWLVIVPRNEAAGLMEVSAVTLRTSKVPCPPPDAEMLTAACPALPAVKLLRGVMTASNAAVMSTPTSA